ncbi:MAG TPA: hypothetical protein VIP11_13405 [Gemmatimonadaceae bacterium]
MRLRSCSAPRVEDAIRRMRAVLEVLDVDLARYQLLLETPIPATVLSDAQWDRAESARIALERSLDELERATATAARMASDWRAKAALAESRGEPLVAEGARLRATEADAEHRLYAQETAAVRVFLNEWAVRVTRSPPKQRARSHRPGGDRNQ